MGHPPEELKGVTVVTALARVFNDNPVFRREWGMLRRGWGWRASAVILWGLFVLIFFAGACLVPSTVRPGASVLLVVQCLAAVLAAVTAAGGALARERAQQTWEALLLTRLEAHEIILGKAAAAVCHALLLAAPAAPLILILALGDLAAPPAGSGTSWMPRLLAAEAYLVLFVLFCAALSVLASTGSRGAADAGQRVGLFLFVSQVAVWPFVTILGGWGTDLVALRSALFFAATASATAALLAAACAALPGYSRSYARPTRIAGGMTYLLVPALLALSAGSLAKGLDTAALALGIHIVLGSLGVLVHCAQALPAAGGRIRAFADVFSRECTGVLGYWMALHILVLGGTGLLVVSGLGAFSWSAPLPVGRLAWAAAFGTAHLLLTGTCGCLAASRWPNLHPSGRTAAASILPVALGLVALALWVPQVLPGAWALALAEANAGRGLGLLVLPNPVVYLTELAAGSPPTLLASGHEQASGLPSRALALAVQTALAVALLWWAQRGRAGARAGDGASAGQASRG